MYIFTAFGLVYVIMASSPILQQPSHVVQRFIEASEQKPGGFGLGCRRPAAEGELHERFLGG